MSPTDPPSSGSSKHGSSKHGSSKHGSSRTSSSRTGSSGGASTPSEPVKRAPSRPIPIAPPPRRKPPPARAGAPEFSGGFAGEPCAAPYRTHPDYAGSPSPSSYDMNPSSYSEYKRRASSKPVPMPTVEGFVPPHILADNEHPLEMARSAERKRKPPDWYGLN